MGIQYFEKNIFKLNKVENEDYIDELHLSKLSNKKIVIDISNFIFKFILKKNTHYLNSFLYMFNTFKKYNIKCIYVFDGNPPKEKKKILEKRKRVRNKNIDKLKDYINELKEFNQDVINKSKVSEKHFIEENYKNTLETKQNIKKNIKKCEKKTYKITKEHTNEIKYLLDLLKIPYIHINYEADLVCAYLVKNNIVDACLTNDTDLIGYQCPIIYKDINFEKETIKMIDINKLSKALKLNLNQLTFLLVLFGCDYSSKIHFNLLEQIYTLLLDNMSIYDITKTYIKNDNILNAYNLFILHIQIDIEKNVKHLDHLLTKYKNVKLNSFEKYKLYINEKEDFNLIHKKNYLYKLGNYINTYYYNYNEI